MRSFSIALVVDSDGGIYRADFAGCSARCVPSCCRLQSQMLGIMVGMDSKDCIALFGSGMCNGGFTGDPAPRAVFFPSCRQAQMFGTIARMDQRTVTLRDSAGGMCKARFAGISHLSLCSSRCSQAQDARHHGRYEPEGQLCVMVLVVQTAKTGFSTVAVHRWLSIFLSWCRGRFPWSCCSADHSYSPVAVLGQGDRWLLCGSCRFSHVVHMPVVCNDRCPVTFRCCISST